MMAGVPEMRLPLLWLGLGLMLCLPACSRSSDAENSVTNSKQNPHPTQRYDITMTIADAPGPFASVKGFMQFDVVNDECLPPPNSNPSGYSSPTPTIEISTIFARISDTEYVGAFYTDMMVDEDYYGEGVCHWLLMDTRVRLEATGAPGETRFLPSLPAESLHAGQAVTTYFTKNSYPRDADIENYPDLGMSDPNKYKPELRGQLFSITLTPKKVIQ